MVAPLSCAGGLLQQPSAQRGGLRRRSRQLPCSTLRAGLLGCCFEPISRWPRCRRSPPPANRVAGMGGEQLATGGAQC